MKEKKINALLLVCGVLTVLLMCMLGLNGRSLKVYAENAGKKEPQSIELSERSITLYKEKKFTLTAKIMPDKAADAEIQWKSKDEDIASVNASGKVTALRYGETKIIARTENGLRAACKVRVVRPAKSIALNKTSVVLFRGDETVLSARVRPVEAADAGVLWVSRNEKIVKADADGKITAVGCGKTTVAVRTKNGLRAVCQVSVLEPPRSINLSKTSIMLFRGKTYALSAQILPAEAAVSGIEWFSKNESVAKIDEKGVITALSCGTAQVGAKTKNGLYAVCQVNVYEEPQSIELSETSVTLFKGKTYALSAWILPAEAAASGVQWFSKNEAIAKVDEKGTITAVNCGTVWVGAKTLNGKAAACSVRVLAIPQKITLSQTSVSLMQGKTLRLKATVAPAEAVGAAVVWKSSNENVAKVDDSGNVTTLA